MRIAHIRSDRALGRRTTRRGQRDGGYILIMFSLLLVPLLLMVGLSVDVGSWYNRGSDMQKAADAAALAGVVWLPRLEKAEEVAIETAAKNGFVDGEGHVTVSVTESDKATRRLKVTITDARVGSFFYEGIAGKTINMSRTAFAEYVTPVPMGSPRNFFGLGTLLAHHSGTGMDPEYLYQSVNAYCTKKENGDRYQSGFHGVCDDGENEEYDPVGYEMYIEAKVGRPDDIDVMLYDARYNEANLGTTRNAARNPCTVNYASSWQTWSGSTPVTITGPGRYNTRLQYSNGTWYWGNETWLVDGETYSHPRNRLRFKPQTNSSSCRLDPSVDSYLGTDGSDAMTFTLYEADLTPLDDSDNVPVPGCSKTFNKNTAFDKYLYLGTHRWNKLCTIPKGAQPGKYILRVQNQGSANGDNTNNGSNQWGLVAKYSSNAENASLCDGRNDNMCPRVYGKESISVKAAAVTQEAAFFLAEIEPEHAGKKLKIELYDPGEGGSAIEIQWPTGTNTWESVPVTWTAEGASTSSGAGMSIDVTGSKFNGKNLEILVDLADYAPPLGNNWWKVHYTFDDPTKPVTDRTTWSARILGDPVHLIEEN